jgi:fumarylpyruvate hydrolase
MSVYAFNPLITSLPLEGQHSRVPIRRVFCVGRNYAAHAREMGKDPDKEPPFFFMKPADAVVESGSVVPYPPETRNLQHEIELVVCIGVGGANIDADRAHAHILGYAVGIDLTRRDLQLAARELGRPWDFGKGFDHSAPCSAIRPGGREIPVQGRIWLAVNGQKRQEADLSALIFPVADIVARISASVSLAPGDLIFTGTPEGVGPLAVGDVVTGGVEGYGEIEIRIGEMRR